MVGQSLPQGFIPALHIYEEKQKAGTMVNMIGIAKDCRLPMRTKNDYKCTVTIFDLSTQGHGDILLNIFKPTVEQIPVIGAGDIIIMLKVKVQSFREEPLSLITNWQSIVLVYEASKIPQPPASIHPALREPITSGKVPLLDKAEAYSSWMYQELDRSTIPDVQTFNIAASRSLNVKDKFSLLEGVRQDRFYNIVVQIVRPPYDLMGKVTIWVTDFTENEAFFNRSPDNLGGGLVDNVPDTAASGDAYGYTSRFRPLKPAAVGPAASGPYGKRCMQVTCYEPHATRVMNIAKPGSWVLISNVQVKYGTNGSNLEGFLREDRGTSHARNQVELLDPRDEPVDTRLKDAIRRKRDYEKAHKAQSNEVQLGKRQRQAEEPDPNPLNSKEKRKKKRKHARQEKEERAAAEAVAASLNQNVRCENMLQPPTSIAGIIETPKYRTTWQMGQPLELQLPFNCVKYRANVRVIDFHPQELRDFASARKRSDYECLDDSSTSSVSDGDLDADDEVIWEWRFALRLQDADKPSASTWVVVDNQDAQLLLSFNACNLRDEPAQLNLLRERLFLLWGNLEETKTAQRKKEEKGGGAQEVPLHSSDVEAAPNNITRLALDNRPFTCCIRQYGIKVAEPNPLKADAGKGRKWKQMFGLFGTKISIN